MERLCKTTVENGEEKKEAHFKPSKTNSYAKFIIDQLLKK